MLWSCFQVLATVLKRCTSPFLFVFLPPIRMISLLEIASALHAHKGFYITVKFIMTYSHPNLVHEPVVLFNFKDFYCIVDLLLGTSKETSERINELVVNCASWQVMALVFHRCSLDPLILRYYVLLNRIQSLLPTESTQNKYVSFAESDGMSIAGFTHRLLGYDLIFWEGVNACIFFRWGATSSNQDFECW